MLVHQLVLARLLHHWSSQVTSTSLEPWTIFLDHCHAARVLGLGYAQRRRGSMGAKEPGGTSWFASGIESLFLLSILFPTSIMII